MSGGSPPAGRPAFALGLVGCGRLGERGYLRAAEAAGIRIVSVADPDPARRALAAGARTFADAGELVSAGGIDAVVVASPTATHVAVARAAAGYGLPALVEKPPAPTAAEAAELLELRPRPFVAFNRRFDPALQGLRARPRSAEPVRLEIVLRYRRRSWGPLVAADDALLDLGPHAVDLARWLTGAEVEAARATQVERERARFELRLDGASAAVACATNALHSERVVVRDRSGKELGRVTRGGVVRAVRGRIGPAHAHPLVPSLARQLAAFADAVRHDHPGELADAADGVAVMRALEAVRRSVAVGGAWQPVEAPTPC